MAPLVTLAGKPLYGVDADGVEWVVTQVSGWNDGADVRADVEVRPGAHGAFPLEPLYGARTVTIEGRLASVSGSSGVRALAESELSRLTSALKPVPLLVDDEPLVLQAAVWRSKKPEYALLNEAAAAFTLEVVAPDPLRYVTGEVPVDIGLPVTASGYTYPKTYPFTYGAVGASGDRVLVNVGDVASPAHIRIGGPVVDPVVRCDTTGEQLNLTITLGGSDWLDIDCREHTVVLNGVTSRRSAVDAGSRWPSVPPGESLWQFRAATYESAALCTVRFRSAYS